MTQNKGSEPKQPTSRIFYGWWNVLIAAIGLFLCYISVVGFTFGILMNSFSREFGWSRGEMSLAFSVSLVAMCAAMPFMGRLVDRFGARNVIVPSLFIFALCMMALYFQSGSLAEFYAIFVVMGIVGGGSSTMPYSSVISAWFNRRRGLALAVAMSGAGIGSFAMPALVQALTSSIGWRSACALLGVGVFLIAVPTVSLFLKDRPEAMGIVPDGEHVEAESSSAQPAHPGGLPRREALQSRLFWLLCTAFFFVSASVLGCLIHLVPMLTDRGISIRNAAIATSIIGGASLVGGLGAGYLLDRFFASYVAAMFFFGAALGIALLWAGPAGYTPYIAAFLIGLGMGAEGQIIPYIVSRYFGLLAFGEIYSYILISFTLGGVVGPLLFGIGYDRTGSYGVVLGTLVFACVVAGGLMLCLGPYRSWDTEPKPASILSD